MNISRSLNWKDTGGFTLIELLVSLVILGLLGLAATSSLSLGTRIWGQAVVAPEQNLVGAELDALRRIIASRTASTGSIGGGLTGTDHYLEFEGINHNIKGYYERANIRIYITTVGLRVTFSSNNINKINHLNLLKPQLFRYVAKDKDSKRVQLFDHWEKQQPVPNAILIKLLGTGDLLLPLQ